MKLIDYAKAYAALALYIVLTSVVGLNFWSLASGYRPVWLIGALAVLLVAVFWQRAPGQRSRRGRV